MMFYRIAATVFFLSPPLSLMDENAVNDFIHNPDGGCAKEGHEETEKCRIRQPFEVLHAFHRRQEPP